MADPTLEELQATVADLKTKVEEFRTNNLALTAKIEKYGDTTPEDIEEAAELKRQRERKELVDAKDIDAALDAQEKKLTEDFERRQKAMQDELDTTKGTLREVSVTSKLKSEAVEAGVRAEAVDDVVGSIEKLFEASNGTLVRMEDGKPALSKKNAGQNEMPAEFFESLAQSKPFYFDGSGGGGGNKDGHRHQGGKRIISKEEFRTGEYAKEIKEGTVEVEGYESEAA